MSKILSIALVCLMIGSVLIGSLGIKTDSNALTTITTPSSGNGNGGSTVTEPTVISTIKMGDGGYGPIAVAVNPSTNHIYVANVFSNNVSVIDGLSNAVVATVGVGSQPRGVAVNPSTNCIYVANSYVWSNIVSVIDGATNTVAATVGVGNGPSAVAVNSSTNLIYVTNSFDTVSVIDGNSNTVVATVNVDSGPTAVAVNPNTNRIYVAHVNSPNVSVIDGTSNSVVATVNVGSSSHGIGVNPNTNCIYVASYSSNDIYVIDGGSNTVVATVNVGSQPYGVAVNPNTNRVYVANMGSHTVSVIDGGSNTVVATMYVESSLYGVAVNPDNNRIYVANQGGNNISVIDGGSNTVIATVIIGSGLCAVAVNPDNNRIYVANRYSGTVSVIDGATNSVEVTVSMGVGNYPIAVAVNQNTNRIYVVNTNGTVSVIDSGSNTVIDTVNVDYCPVAVAVNPSTNRIYVASIPQGSGKVSVIDGDSNDVVATIGMGGRQTQGVAVNPSTNRIYVTSGNGSGVSVIDGASNTEVTTIATVGSYPVDVAVNPSTNRIYVAIYYGLVGTGGHVSVIDGSSNTEVSVVETGGGLSAIAVNPSTNRVYVDKGYGTVCVIDGVCNTVVATVATTEVPTESTDVAVNPNTNRIYVTNSGSDSISVIQDSSNAEPPVASFTYSPQNPIVGENIIFDASSSYDEDGQIVSYNWDFGDGNTTEGKIVTYTYCQSDNYVTTLTVTDNNGLTNSCSLNLQVNSPPPPPSIKITTAKMVSPSVLGIDAEIGLPLEIGSHPIYIKFQAVINGKSVETAPTNIRQFVPSGGSHVFSWSDGDVSDDVLKIDLAAEGVPRFTENQVFDVKGIAYCDPISSNESVFGPVRIPLPVIIIHGYLYSQKIIENQVVWVFDKLKRWAYKDLMSFLCNINIGYSENNEGYRTLWGPTWGELGTDDRSYDALKETPESISPLVDNWVNTALERSYASKVNLIGHSTGGLVARWYVASYPNTKVNKVIMIGTPHLGLIDSYKYAFEKPNREEADRILLSPATQTENLLGWFEPNYYTNHLFTFDSDDQLVPVPEPYENNFNPISDDSVEYYSIFADHVSDTPSMLMVEQRDNGWYKVVSTLPGWGDGAILAKSAGAFYPSLPPITSGEHAYLCTEYTVQIKVLHILLDNEQVSTEHGLGSYVYGQILAQQSISYPVHVDQTYVKAEFGLTWPGSKLDLILHDPIGNEINPQVVATDPNIDFIYGDTYQQYTVLSPTAGDWIMEIRAIDVPEAGEEYTTNVELLPDQPPIAYAGNTYEGIEGSLITFDASGSYDSDGIITNYNWDFGDGSTSTEIAPTHSYSKYGVYTVTLTVTDDDGLTGTDTAAVTVTAVVTFPDPNLDAAIRDALNKPTGDITTADLAGLTSLAAFKSNITNISGIEYCTNMVNLNLGVNRINDISLLASLINLTWLNLGGNQINDLSSLASLTGLTEIYLWNNQISNLSPLSSLTSLNQLWLDGNQISDLSPLSSLTSLTWLNLAVNQISDLSPLSSLTSLTWLDLQLNQISDLSPLTSLTNLNLLDLRSNQISDITPLVVNSGLGAGDTIDIWNNKLDLWEGSEDLANIEALEARGVTVYHDDIWVPFAIIIGQVYEVKGMTLQQGPYYVIADATITLIEDGVVQATTLTDEQGNYTLPVPESGTYSVTASKNSFRLETQSIDILTQGQESTLNFKSTYGLIPNAPSMWYLLDCAALWKYPPAQNPELGLDIWTLLDVAGAWKYPK